MTFPEKGTPMTATIHQIPVNSPDPRQAQFEATLARAEAAALGVSAQAPTPDSCGQLAAALELVSAAGSARILAASRLRPVR